MVLTDAAAGLIRDLAWQLEAADAVLKVPRLPLYVGADRAFLDTGAAQLRAVGVAQPARASASRRRSTGSCRCGAPTS